jgi:hypothetical protein
MGEDYDRTDRCSWMRYVSFFLATHYLLRRVKRVRLPTRPTFLSPFFALFAGKTAISLMLSRLFGFAHTQSDDVQAKKTGPKFVQAVAELLKKPDVQVVIADR